MRIYKRIKMIFLVAVTFCLFASCGKGPDFSLGEVEKESSSNKQEQVQTLNEMLKEKSGSFYWEEKDALELETSTNTDTILGNADVGDMHIKGLEDSATLKITGGGFGVIRAFGDGLLKIENFLIKNFTPLSIFDGTGNGYLSFGGRIQFINCRFETPVFIEDDANIECIDCSFKNEISNMYTVWVADGTASFVNCSFTGQRGIKIHEENTWDVVSVQFQSCEFFDIIKKPAFAIGDIIAVPENTVVRIANCTFDNCAGWDKMGAKEGIDGFYESDTLTESFAFSEENNLVDGLPSDVLFKEFQERKSGMM